MTTGATKEYMAIKAIRGLSKLRLGHSAFAKYVANILIYIGNIFAWVKDVSDNLTPVVNSLNRPLGLMDENRIGTFN